MGSSTLAPRSIARNPELAIAALITAVTAGCSDPLPGSGGGGSGGPYDGVYVGCDNPELGGGADETAGEDDGGGGTPNYWWRDCSPAPQTYPLCEEGANAEICCFAGGQLCLCKEYELIDSSDYNGGVGPICVTPSYDAGDVDPLEDWVADEGGGGWYPEIDAALRAECSQQCQQSGSPIHPTMSKLCEDANWIAARTYNGWDPGDGLNCEGSAELNGDDPDGSEVPWELVGGPTYPVPLDCDLDGDCASWFYPSVARFVLTPGSAGIIEPETRFAHYLAVETTGSSIELNLDLSGTGTGIDDTEPLFGLAEYSALDCGDPVCPFYLGNLSAYNTVDSWEVAVSLANNTRQKKSISNVQIDLLQSTLGVHHIALDTIAFAPGALRLRVQFDVANNGTGTSYGNGTHSAIVENDDYVFAEYDDGALQLTHTFDLNNGEATLMVSVAPDEEPPVAAHDLQSTEACDTSGGLLLDDSYSLSTDPDNDIDLEFWWVDGAPFGNGGVLTSGSHFVTLEARDTRGAADRTDGQWVYVTTGCT